MVKTSIDGPALEAFFITVAALFVAFVFSRALLFLVLLLARRRRLGV